MRLAPPEGGQALRAGSADQSPEAGVQERGLFLDPGESARAVNEIIVEIQRRPHMHESA